MIVDSQNKEMFKCTSAFCKKQIDNQNINCVYGGQIEIKSRYYFSSSKKIFAFKGKFKKFKDFPKMCPP